MSVRKAEFFSLQLQQTVKFYWLLCLLTQQHGLTPCNTDLHCNRNYDAMRSLFCGFSISHQNKGAFSSTLSLKGGYYL